MKKLFLTITLVATSVALNAQSVKLQSAISDSKNDRLDKAKANIDEACEHEGTKDDPKTWRYKAEIYYKIGTTTKDKFKNLDPNAMQVAYEAAAKSIQLDTEKEFFNNNYATIKNITVYYYNQGVDGFNNKDYNLAMSAFEKVGNMSKTIGDAKGMGDGYYNAAVAAEQLKDKEKAAKIYNELVKINYANPNVYAIVYQSYKDSKETDKALAVAEKSAAVGEKLQAQPKQPGKTVVTYVYYFPLLDAYFSAGNTAKAEEIITKILETEPNNPDVLNKIGSVLEGAGKADEAKAKYEASLLLKAEQYEANYNIGAWFFNRGVDKMEEANKVPLSDKTGAYDKLKAESIKYFNDAVPYLENSLKYKPNDQRALVGLKQIYAHTEQFEKVKEIDAKLNQGK